MVALIDAAVSDPAPAALTVIEIPFVTPFCARGTWRPVAAKS
jgi:hypothetical protein